MSQSPFVVKKKTFKASDKGVLSDCLGYIEAELKSLKINRKLAIRAVLISEEMISEFIKHGSENSSITISVKHIIGDTKISITSEGTEFDPYSQLGMGLDLGKEDVTDEQSHEAIRSILLKSMGEKLRYSHRKGVNTAKIIVGQSEKSMLYATVIALVLGIIFGLLMKFVFPEGVSSGISAPPFNPSPFTSFPPFGRSSSSITPLPCPLSSITVPFGNSDSPLATYTTPTISAKQQSNVIILLTNFLILPPPHFACLAFLQPLPCKYTLLLPRIPLPLRCPFLSP